MDEMWSFVMRKAGKAWIWLVADVWDMSILAGHIGARDGRAARALWEKMPEYIRRKAVFFTDDWKPYEQILPPQRHVKNEPSVQNLIERINNTLRQRISRLVRKTLSFSKKFKNHKGAIFYFINHYNQSLHS